MDAFAIESRQAVQTTPEAPRSPNRSGQRETQIRNWARDCSTYLAGRIPAYRLRILRLGSGAGSGRD